ncbi:hypothetical protein HON52_04265 [Candidatus Uhrbacteria bacterium]|jgi:hypothetical protein|nr:hypothetical protein [Candidatus Uhrbacteria bacterium]
MKFSFLLILSLFTVTGFAQIAYAEETRAYLEPEDCFYFEYYDYDDYSCVIDCSTDEECEELEELLDDLLYGDDDTSEDIETSVDGETAIVAYVAYGSSLSSMEVGTSLTSVQTEYAEDTDLHQSMWDTFVGIAGEDFVIDHVSGFSIFTDSGESDTLAYVVQDSWDLTKWIVSLDIEDMLEDPEEFNETLIHEFTHILTLESDQVPVSDILYEDVSEEEYATLYDEAVADCPTYFTGEGCSNDDSYIYLFVEEFWAEWIESGGPIDTNFGEIDFYTDNEDNFVTWYAATNPGEDIAESFSYFVVKDKSTGTTVGDQKWNFFYEFAELVDLRDTIRTFLGIEVGDTSDDDSLIDEIAERYISDDDSDPQDIFDEIAAIQEYVAETAETSLLIDRLAGQIMLLVDRDGEAWYIDPVTRFRYYLADGPTAYEFLRTFGLGITNADLEQVPTSDDAYGGGTMAEALSGRILLQVEENGEAWYVNPSDLKRYYMADGAAAYTIMRELSEGTLAEWIEMIYPWTF